MAKSQITGKFVWFELNTTNLQRAKSFYGELVGWKIESVPMGDTNYDMVHTAGGPIAGLLPGTSSRWLSYLSVADVDAAAKKVLNSGGKVLKTPFDYPGVGRMSLVADPSGAEFFLFKNADGDAPDREVKQGDWYWNELTVTDPAKVVKFYRDVAGFDVKEMNMGEMGTYYVLEHGGVPRAGIMKGEAAAPWLPYIHVEKIDETAARAPKLGATVAVPPTDIPTVGRFAVFVDPTGATIAAITPEVPAKK